MTFKRMKVGHFGDERNHSSFLVSPLPPPPPPLLFTQAFGLDQAKVVEVLRTSPNDIVQINDDGSKIRRSTTNPLKLDADFNKRRCVCGASGGAFIASADALCPLPTLRSIYTKGWDLEKTTVDKVEDYFTKKGWTLDSAWWWASRGGGRVGG